MSIQAYRRVGIYFLRKQWFEDLLGHMAGISAAILYLVWIIFLMLLIDLLQTGGRLEVTEANLQSVLQRNVESVEVGSQLENAGLLPTVIGAETRGSIFTRPLSRLYDNQGWVATNATYLFGLLWLTFVVGLIRAGLLVFVGRQSKATTASAIENIQQALFQHKFTLGSQAFQPDVGARIGPILREQVPKLQRAMEVEREARYLAPVQILVLLTFVLVSNFWLGLSFLLLASVIWVAGSPIWYRSIRRQMLLARAAELELGRLLGLADKLQIIKGYAADNYFQEQYARHLAQYRNDTLREMQYRTQAQVILRLAILVLALVVLGLGAQNVLIDKFSLASMVGVYTALASLGFPISRAIESHRQTRIGGDAAASIFEFLERTHSTSVSEGTRFLNPLTKSIDFERVSFRNARGNRLLQDLSIRIHAGQRIALLGTSETEVLTIAYLLGRFLDPTEGKIRIDGQDIRDGTLESLRSQMALVLQSDLVFPDTVANNIGCGDPGYKLTQIIAAAKVAHAHHFIQRLPEGYECLVGEQGFPLEPGESYRLALARAVLRDPPLVIIEEPKGQLDDETELLLEDTMNRFLPGRTSLLIPRRLDTLRSCDSVFVFDEGKLVACGTQRELVETSELYRHLEFSLFGKRALAPSA